MCIYPWGERGAGGALRRTIFICNSICIFICHIWYTYTYMYHLQHTRQWPNSRGLITALPWPAQRTVVTFNDSSVRSAREIIGQWAMALNNVANDEGNRLAIYWWLRGQAMPDRTQAGHSSMDSISVAATAKSTVQLANDEPAPAPARAALLPIVIVELLWVYCF